MSSPAPCEIAPSALMEALAGTKVQFKWLGTQKSLTDEEKEDMARSKGVSADMLRLGKSLLNTKNEHYRALTKIQSRVKDYWHSNTLPWVDPGIRLLKRTDLQTFTETMDHFSLDLEAAAQTFGEHYEEVLQEARSMLGPLWHRSDYPQHTTGLFGLSYSFPNLAPPSYLDPEVFEREMQLRSQQFAQSLELAEAQFAEELARMVERLLDALQPAADGTKKILRGSVVEGFRDFFETFKKLNFRSGSDLAQVVAQAEALVGDVDPAVLRVDKRLKLRLSESMDQVLTSLDSCSALKRKRTLERVSRVGTEPPVEASSPPGEACNVA